MISRRPETESTHGCEEQNLGRLTSNKIIARHLELLLASPDFEATPTQRALLQYLVNQALAGKADGIDVFTVAARVFGRGSDYDPATDPIAPIQTDGLRRVLARYYRTAGQQAPVRIEIPRGTYVPTFSDHESPPGE